MLRMIVLAAFCSCASVIAANARPLSVYDDHHNTVTIKVADTDLQTVQGAKRLAFVVRVAASEVCGGDDVILRRGFGFDECREAAIDRALRGVNAPMLSQALGRPPPTLAEAR